METKFNFKSSVCTSREQSERLLALGLKKETADMCYQIAYWDCGFLKECSPSLIPHNIIDGDRFIPAWSLHRLWDILPEDVEVDDSRYVTSHLEGKKAIVYHDYGCHYYNFDKKNNIYDNIIDCIEWLIKKGYFNKEYLV